MRILQTIVIGLCLVQTAFAQGIDRYSVVSRHNILTTSTIPKSPAQVGNGVFAFCMDVTGLQTFTPFNTLSDWGWHSEPLPPGKKVSDYKAPIVESFGKEIPLMLPDPSEPELTSWLSRNPHKFNLGRIGFILLRTDGSIAEEKDLIGTSQKVDLWTGIVSSDFTLDGEAVHVRTSCHPEKDIVAVSVESALMQEGKLKVFLDFPYSDKQGLAVYIGNYDVPSKHITSILSLRPDGALLRHTLDSTSYEVALNWSGKAKLTRESPDYHKYILTPPPSGNFEFTCRFLPGCAGKKDYSYLDSGEGRFSVAEVEKASAAGWKSYWTSGAAIDLSGSKDTRWMELERRIVLSQYVMRLNECGLYPPQESGLVSNSWDGRFHFEMIWWHVAHYALWNKMDCFDKYLGVYRDFLPEARNRAASEGRSGARWPKCTGNFNREWPGAAHALLIWQQPHPIYLAEMDYRAKPSSEILDKWKDVVIATADYMADYVFWDPKTKKYIIAPPVTVLSENSDPYVTLNPIFELEYFHYGLKTALTWAKRLGLPESRTKKWRSVLKHLSPLPQEDGYYVSYEGIKDMWTKYNYEHPAITGIFGWLPGDNVDKAVFKRTFDRIQTDWTYDKVWGWDYPMMAMAAARMGEPRKAVDLLLENVHKFKFDEHGLCQTWPYPYFPTNGALLTAVAMMCEGWDGSSDKAPGFPTDGSWTVKYEGFNRMQ